MRISVALLLLAGLTGCGQTKHVTGPEFRREYELRNTQTMVSAEYLGERDGKVFLLRKTMSLTSHDKWKEETWFTETNNLPAAFLAQLKAGGAAAAPASLTVILFDSPDSTHPSPRDSRWVVTNRNQVAAIVGHFQSARVTPPTVTVPACAVVACVEIPATNDLIHRTLIQHVHFPTSVLLIRDDKHIIARDGAAFLADLARAGVPTNQLQATKHEGK
jgi:hypothetical protein